jgi:hypothetical protein
MALTMFATGTKVGGGGDEVSESCGDEQINE